MFSWPCILANPTTQVSFVPLSILPSHLYLPVSLSVITIMWTSSPLNPILCSLSSQPPLRSLASPHHCTGLPGLPPAHGSPFWPGFFSSQGYRFFFDGAIKCLVEGVFMCPRLCGTLCTSVYKKLVNYQLGWTVRATGHAPLTIPRAGEAAFSSYPTSRWNTLPEEQRLQVLNTIGTKLVRILTLAMAMPKLLWECILLLQIIRLSVQTFV